MKFVNNTVIAIPSYRRSTAIAKKTLAFLDKMRVHPEHVYIFVADEGELFDYQLGLPDKWAGNLIVSCPGVQHSRNFIKKYFPKGTQIFFMDDDVRNMAVRNPGSNIHMPRKEQGHWITPEEFRKVLKKGFDACAAHGARIWGVYPTDNPSHMRDRVFTGLAYVVAAAFGMVAHKSTKTDTIHGVKEDHERTLRHWKADGKIVRLEWVGVSTTYFGGTGGLHSDSLDARHKRADAVIDKLVAEFPEVCQVITRKNPTCRDIKLKRVGTNYPV